MKKLLSYIFIISPMILFSSNISTALEKFFNEDLREIRRTDVTSEVDKFYSTSNRFAYNTINTKKYIDVNKIEPQEFIFTIGE